MPDFSLSKSQISEIYLQGSAALNLLCDAFQGSIGGQVIAGDGNYSAAGRIRMNMDDGLPVKPTALQGCK
jgi:hypothetical protein